MEVSAVIPTLNRAQDLNRCLTALAEQRDELREVIVIDNGSTDKTSEVISKFEVKSVRDTTRNLTRLFNLGWERAEGDIIAYLNDDSEPSPTWAKWIKHAFAQNPDVAMVGGPTIDVNRRQIETLLAKSTDSALIWLAARIYDRVVTRGRLKEIGLMFNTGGFSIGGYYDSAARLEEAIQVDQLTVTNVAIKKLALITLGGFDERFLFNHADGDLFARARNANLKLLFHPKVVVFHHANPAGPVRNPQFLGIDTARFLMRSVRPQGLGDLIGWLANMLAFNLFWVYKAFETGRASQLAGIRGFAQGISRVIREGS